ncbi:hypothetical protein TNCV_753971 [Trichonephila clavipes]|nr:hypothetical protein TNCV_753971 [Trichonephila clavipes]
MDPFWGGTAGDYQSRSIISRLRNRYQNIECREDLSSNLMILHIWQPLPDAMFTDDNKLLFTARVLNQYEEQETLLRMELPARSLDLNPTEQGYSTFFSRRAADT